MNPEYELYEQIDLYLSQKLSKEDLAQFNERLAQDQNLQALVEAQKTANGFIVDQEMIRLKERMRKEMDGNSGSGNSTKIKIALSSILLISASLYTYSLLTSDKTSDTNQNNPPTQGSLDKVSTKTDTKEEISSTKKITNTTSQIETKPTAVASDESINSSSAKIPSKEVEKIIESTTNSTNVKTESSTNTNPITEPKIIDCETVKISASVDLYYSTNGDEATISIDKKTIQHGTSPYQYSLDNEQFSSSPSFEITKEGSYKIYIKDQNNCITLLKKPVVVKWTPKVKEMDAAFAPAQGEKWSFPLDNHKDATLSILNKAGSLVYTANITGGYPSDWDGRDSNGNELESGYYYFILNFTNNEMVKGHITILR